jgi:hypothetical protein
MTRKRKHTNTRALTPWERAERLSRYSMGWDKFASYANRLHQDQSCTGEHYWPHQWYGWPIFGDSHIGQYVEPSHMTQAMQRGTEVHKLIEQARIDIQKITTVDLGDLMHPPMRAADYRAIELRIMMAQMNALIGRAIHKVWIEEGGYIKHDVIVPLDKPIVPGLMSTTAEIKPIGNS